MTTTVTEDVRTRGRSAARVGRYLGTALLVLGVLLLAWSGIVWKWGDPVTAVYTNWEQRKLDDELDALIADRPPRPTVAPGGSDADPTTPQSRPEPARRMHREAAGFRAAVDSGSAIGRLEVPRLGVDMVMVEGTASDDLKRGPGRDERTFMPGEGKLVYVAGHRTTYSAPFARIDALRPGDRITVEMPYGTFVYTVTRHRIVDDQDLSVLRSGPGEELALQACHPRFFATQRYIVWAKPARPRSADGRVYALPDSS